MAEIMDGLSLLTQSWVHFLLSGLAGCLVYLLTQITCYAVIRTLHGDVLLTTVQSRFILGLAFVLAFCAAWYAHVLLDGFSIWWITPLGPPLNIIS